MIVPLAAMRLPNGGVRFMDDVPSIADLTAQGAEVVCTTEPQRFLDGMFYRQRRNPARHAVRARPARSGAQDRRRQRLGAGRVADGRALAGGERLRARAWWCLSACSHAGIVNVLKHARASFPTCRCTP